MGTWGHPCPKPSTAFGSACGPQKCQVMFKKVVRICFNIYIYIDIFQLHCDRWPLTSSIGFQCWTFVWQYYHCPRPTESICWWSISKAFQEEAAEDEEKVGEPNGNSLPQLHGCQESVRCSISWIGGSNRNQRIDSTPNGFKIRGILKHLHFFNVDNKHLKVRNPLFCDIPKSSQISSTFAYSKARWTSTEAFPSLPSSLWP